jgi:NADPH:quinone reductase-like Zn-dependent oxidoreductase
VRETHPDGVDALTVAVNLREAFAGTNVFGQSDPAALGTVLGMAADGTLEVPITRRYAFDELPQALGLEGERRSRGTFAVSISS